MYDYRKIERETDRIKKLINEGVLEERKRSTIKRKSGKSKYQKKEQEIKQAYLRGDKYSDMSYQFGCDKKTILNIINAARKRGENLPRRWMPRSYCEKRH